MLAPPFPEQHVDAPANYKNAGIANLIGAGLTIMWSLGVMLSLALSLFGLCFAPVYLVWLGIACWQAFVGWKMYQGEAVANAKTASLAGAIGSFLSGNLLAAAGGAFAVLQCNTPEVAGWIESSS